MRVKELIEALSEMDPDAPVHFSYNYGDHWHTQVAPLVRKVDEGEVVFSDYHRMCVLDDGSKDIEPVAVVLLST